MIDNHGIVYKLFFMSTEVEVWSRIKSVAEASAYRIEVKWLVVLQVDCTSVYNKALEFWGLVDTYNLDVIIGKEHGLRRIFAMLKSSGLILQLSEGRGLRVLVGFFASIKNIIACTEFL